MRGLTDMEAAEVETVRKIVSLAERNRTRELEKIRKLTRSITESAAVVKARVKVLEDKMNS
jgi:transposase